MINISIGSGRVKVASGAGEPPLGGLHRAYLETILNFRRSTDGTTFETTEGIRTSEVLQAVVEYLTEEALPFELQPDAQRVLERTSNSATELAESIAKGREILEGRAGISGRVPGFKRTLLDHQVLPARHLIEVVNAANFSVPGAGKTTMVLAAFKELQHRGMVDKLVVIGPGSSFLAWEEEYALCVKAPGIVVRLSGDPQQRQLAYQGAREAELVLITYHTANNDQLHLIELLRSSRCVLVLDESHYIKGTGTLAQMVLNIAPEATKRIVLTGTPMPNGYLDLWTQATFLWPEQHLFGNRLQFRTLVSSEEGQQEVKGRIRPLFTRVRKSDLKLPPQRFKKIHVSMGDVQKRIYDALAAKTLKDVEVLPAERVTLRQWRRAKMVRLLQAATNPALLSQHSIEFSIPPEDSLGRPLLELAADYLKFEMPKKVLAADKLARKLLANPNEKVVIWSHFVQNVELLLDLLKDCGALPLYGAIPREGPDEEEQGNREAHIRAFRTNPNVRVLVANPGAAAESISLHKVCHHAIYLDRTFNAGQFIQSRDRIHRVGLTEGEEVTYHLLMTEGSIDETVDNRLTEKEQLMLAALEDPDLPVTGLEIATDHLSGPNEEEEAIDFDAVLKDIKRRRQK